MTGSDNAADSGSNGGGNGGSNSNGELNGNVPFDNFNNSKNGDSNDFEKFKVSE